MGHNCRTEGKATPWRYRGHLALPQVLLQGENYYNKLLLKFVGVFCTVLYCSIGSACEQQYLCRARAHTVWKSIRAVKGVETITTREPKTTTTPVVTSDNKYQNKHATGCQNKHVTSKRSTHATVVESMAHF